MNTYETPQKIKDLYNLNYRTEDGCIDFQPYANFQSPEETAQTMFYWTGNPDYKGEDLRIFGADGTGSLFAIWLKRGSSDILDEPVVFLGSEGEIYVISINFSDFLWCLKTGLSYSENPKDHIVTESVSEFVKNNAITPERASHIIFDAANDLIHDFVSHIESKIKY